MTSQPSGSEQPFSQAGKLAEPVQRWIWQQKWKSLRDVQEKAIGPILAGGDVILSARTAAGKTEAAFLPLLTRVLQQRARGLSEGFDVLYVSPLKALINDQARRLESLVEGCALALHRWHGDVDAGQKAKARARPSGVVLITPESLEATLVRRGGDVPRLFSNLTAVVIDELHAFIGRDRGMQLQSILARIEAACGRTQLDRIGLSATLGDMRLAAEYLRPDHGEEVTLVEGLDEGNGVRLQVRGYAEQKPAPGSVASGLAAPSVVNQDVANDLFRTLRGHSNLFFAGSRQRVEAYTDALSQRCEDAGVPNEFFAHHGNLSKSEREDVELRLREDPRPTTAIATTTLELGIDVGDVESVAQLGPGFSVSSLRQRLGRSGRRPGHPAIMRIFVTEEAPEAITHPVDRLRLDLVQSIAMVECMLERWCEPPDPLGLHLSTLLHQTLALIIQRGALKPLEAYAQLCEIGPFRRVTRELYATLLRAMAAEKLIETSTQGELMLAEQGERIVESHEFYAVFETPPDYRVINGSTTLGVLPADHVVAPGQTLIFAGRRWLTQEVDDRARVVLVVPTQSAMPPTFGGGFAGIHDRIVAKMREILSDTSVPPYLDTMAKDMLDDARGAYFEMGLDRRSVYEVGRGAFVFPWVGTKRLDTLALALMERQFKVGTARHCLEIDNCDPKGLRDAITEIAAAPPPDGRSLASHIGKPFIAKFDRYLGEKLLAEVAAVERLDPASLPRVAARCLLNR